MPENYTELNDPTDTTRTRLALERCRAEIEAVPEAELLHITVEIPSAAATILGALPKIRALEPELEKLPDYDPLLLERAEARALAMFQSQANYISASRPAEPIHELVAATPDARDRLYPQASALVDRGLFPKEALEGYRGTPGHKILTMDVTVLCGGFRQRWLEMKGKTPVTLAELDRSEMLVEKLITAIGEREQAPALLAAATLFRQKAFTLAVKTYGELRHGVIYLRRRQGDADRIAPSLYRGRGGSRRRDDEDPAEPAAVTPPSAGGAPVTPATPSVVSPTGTIIVSPTGTSVLPSTGATPSEIPPGYPGSSPFLRG